MLVLWVLALLTVIALSLTTAQRTQSELTANQLEATRFRAQAEAGINLAALNLLSTPTVMPDDPATVWIPDGRARELTIDGDRLELRLYDEAARLQLNRIDRQQLAYLIELAQGEEGFDEQQRDQIADAILDWRDQNDATLLNGAEDADYRDLGRPFGAADGPFRDIRELRLVLGMTEQLYRRLSPHLTVAETPQGLSDTYAPPEVIAVSQGLLLDDARRLVEQREALRQNEGAPATTPRNRGGPLYRLQISQLDEDGYGRRMQALLRVPGDRGAPFAVLWRRYGLFTETVENSGYTVAVWEGAP